MRNIIFYNVLNKILVCNAVWDVYAAVLTLKGWGLHLSLYGEEVEPRTRKLLAVWLLTYAGPRFLAGVSGDYDTLAIITYLLEGAYWADEEQWSVSVLSYLLAGLLLERTSNSPVSSTQAADLGYVG